MKLSIALLAAPALAFAPQAQQAASVKLEAHKEVAAATLAAGALLAPFAAFAGDIESGETLFAGNCAACHAGGNNVIAAEKTLRKDALDKYLAGGRKESSVVTQVTNGKNAMPAFGGCSCGVLYYLRVVRVGIACHVHVASMTPRVTPSTRCPTQSTAARSR